MLSSAKAPDRSPTTCELFPWYMNVDCTSTAAWSHCLCTPAALTQCSATQYESTAPTSTTNRVCTGEGLELAMQLQCCG